MNRPARAQVASANGRGDRLMPASWLTARDTLQARWTALAARANAAG